MARSENRPKIGLVLKFNRTTNAKSKGKETFLNDFYKRLVKAVKGVSAEKVVKALRQDSTYIKEAVEADLDAYTKRVLSFFLSVQSPDTSPTPGRKGRPSSRNNVLIKFNDLGGPISATAVTPIGASRATGFSVVWQALAPSTIARKRRIGSPNRGLNFFVKTGDLQNTLNSSLGPAFRDLVDFRIVIDESKDDSNQVAVVRAFPSTKLTRSNLGFLGGPEDATKNTAGGNASIVNFLRAASSASVEAKLTNRGRGAGRAQRPFIQQALAFWVTRRFPSALDRAVRVALRRNK